jgi:four helix bundle protein
MNVCASIPGQLCMGDFRKLQVWQRSRKLALAVYHHSREFPPVGRYGLTAQLRRAALSIAVNIAEGCGGNARLEFARFLRCLLGCAHKVSYPLLVAKDLELLPIQEWTALDSDVHEI